jgi:hypothetical protein
MPTLKAEEFCQAFYTWAEACQTELPTDNEDQKQWRKEFADLWSFIEFAIHKSCLLDRLIYAREPLRTEMCPVHKIKWSGCVLGEVGMWLSVRFKCHGMANAVQSTKRELSTQFPDKGLQGRHTYCLIVNFTQRSGSRFL